MNCKPFTLRPIKVLDSASESANKEYRADMVVSLLESMRSKHRLMRSFLKYPVEHRNRRAVSYWRSEASALILIIQSLRKGGAK